jgi:multidrug efflux system membrane fusion protein
LSFRVAGKITHRSIEVGDRVRKGQLLAKLDASDYRLGTQALQAQLKSAQADRDFAKDDLARYRELLNQRVISPPEFDRHKTVYTKAQDKVATLQAQLHQTSNQLAYTELASDRDSVVTALEIETGQMVSAGQPVIKLARLDEKEIQFDVPEQRVADIKLNQAIEAGLWATGGRRFQARIREIATTAEPVSRTYRIKATLLDGLDNARLGMTATIWLPADTPTTITVPLSAVFSAQDKPNRPQVWVVDETHHTVKSGPIQLGVALDGERIGITGLDAGQLVVSAGVQRLKEGQVVRLLDNGAAGKQEQQP